jgi:hypothetical protein
MLKDFISKDERYFNIMSATIPFDDKSSEDDLSKINDDKYIKDDGQ